jgi:endonuclease/exonuclease/phosphatase family metal-dependent hydrolase
MTFNIRVNVRSDSLNAWPFRKETAAGMIRARRADLVGVQEALKDQVLDLAGRLEEYGWFGRARDDGAEEGEYNPVFYRKDRFELLRDSTFWLSGNPSVPGKGWDAACVRIVTWGEFGIRGNGGRFFLFNTHFDHQGKIARAESARLLLKEIRRVAGRSEAVVTGDFNSDPDSAPYRILTNGSAERGSEFRLIDSEALSLHPHRGPDGTFNGFGRPDADAYGPPIDFIFVTKNLKVLNHGTLDETFDGRYPSDHWPVLAEIVLE